jgi:hypothetical protein
MANKTLREKIARLIEELNKAEQELNDKDSYGDYVGRTPTQQNPVKTVQLMIPSNPLDLTPRIPRPQDVAYQEALKKAKAKEKNQTLHDVDQLQIEKGVLNIFSHLAQALTDSHNSFTLQKWGRKDKDSEETECDNKMNAENDDETNDEEDDKTQEESNDSDTSEDEKGYNMTAGNKDNSSRSENEPEQRDQRESNPNANPPDERKPNLTPNASANGTRGGLTLNPTKPNPNPNESERKTKSMHRKEDENETKKETTTDPRGQSSSVTFYVWDECKFQHSRGSMSTDAPDDLSWRETIKTWERKESHKIIQRDCPSTPKLRTDTNLFVDEVRRPPENSSDNKNVSDDLVFPTRRRQRGIIKRTYTHKCIPTQPNPFEELNKEKEEDNEAEEETLERKATPNKDPDKEQQRYAWR